MQNALQDFKSEYIFALESYLTEGGEVALQAAYELGRKALGFESGLLVVTEVHHHALHAVLTRTNPEKSLRIFEEATDFLSECLSPFEMAQRGFQESIAVLNTLNKALQRQEQDLHLLLSPMPNLLLTIDKQNGLVAFFTPLNFPPIIKKCKVGMKLAEVLPDEIIPQVMDALPQVRQSQQILRLECSLFINGQKLYFDLQISPVYDSQELLLVIDDITQRKEIELAEHEQRILAEALRDTALALNSSLDLNEVLNHVVLNIGKVVPHDTANVMLIKDNDVYVARSFGYTSQELAVYEKRISRLRLSEQDAPTLYKAFQIQSSITIADLSAPTTPHEYLGLGTNGSGICAPILIAGGVIGFINLNRFLLNFFTSTHVENLQSFINQAAIAIQNAQLFKQAQEVATLEERQRLARDLHDSVSQSLFSASIITESLPTIWNRNPDKAIPLIADLHKLVRGAAAEMRILLWELRPTNITSTTLDKLMTQLAHAVQGRTKMTVVITVAKTQQLPQDVHIVFYRIAQEALNNVVKHSNATEVGLRLYTEGKKTILRIHDNGHGFNVEQSTSGFGLENMRERAQLVGALFMINSKPGKGTEITFSWSASSVGKRQPA